MNSQFNDEYSYQEQQSYDAYNVQNAQDSVPIKKNVSKPVNPKKELKDCIKKNKKFSKILKNIKKNLSHLTKWEQNYKKAKINKDDFKNHDELFNGFLNLINKLREEKYSFESKIIENNKKIDKLKDSIKK